MIIVLQKSVVYINNFSIGMLHFYSDVFSFKIFLFVGSRVFKFYLNYINFLLHQIISTEDLLELYYKVSKYNKRDYFNQIILILFCVWQKTQNVF